MLLSFKLIKGKHYLKKIIINKNSKVFDQLEKKKIIITIQNRLKRIQVLYVIICIKFVCNK